MQSAQNRCGNAFPGDKQRSGSQQTEENVQNADRSSGIGPGIEPTNRENAYKGQNNEGI